MATVAEAIAVAITHHQAGRLQEAEQIYRQVLAVDPGCVDAWNLLGVMASQLGQFAAGEQCARNALTIKPDSGELYYNLAIALQGQRKLDGAIAAYRRALDFDPNHAGAHNNLGNALQDQGKLTEAIACHRKALERNPGFIEAHYNLGNAFKAQGDWDSAIGSYGLALAQRPQWPQALSNLGSAFLGRGDFEQAIASYRRALQLMPDSPEVHTNLGSALQKQGKLDEAIAAYRRAVQLSPDLPESRLNLGVGLHEQGALDEAIEQFRLAIALKPDYAEALNALGLSLRDQGQIDEARQCFRRSLDLKPDDPEAHTNLAILMLQAGDFEHGWREYEWRWKSREMTPRNFHQPQWEGQAIAGQTILLHAEQGLGDTLQFIRYAALVKAQGATVIVECSKALIHLLGSCRGIDHLIAAGDEPPPFDVHAPLLSLPRIFNTTLDTIPAQVPYLFAESSRVARWQNALAHLRGFCIGINWRGRAGQGVFRRRDIPLEYFLRLAKIPGVQLVSLQKGAGRDELAGDAASRRPIFDPGDQLDSDGAFLDTAAIMMNLDLVITSDTSVPHLAGALGLPVWVALPHLASWQWLCEREDSPWYPTMQLFRQEGPEDWSGVFDRIQAALQQRIAAKR